MEMKISDSMTVFLADGHDQYRSALEWTLESEDGIEVVGDTGDGGDLVEMVANARPQIILMDHNILMQLGMDAIHKMSQSEGKPVLIIHSMHDDHVAAEKAIKAGA
jgi:two-component system response regulator DegU